MAAWTFDGSVPGKPVRVHEGDTVDFTLINPATNKNSHAMDFHAAQVNVLMNSRPSSQVKASISRLKLKFPAYSCTIAVRADGSTYCQGHVRRNSGRTQDTKNYPKADREYVLIQQQYFQTPRTSVPCWKIPAGRAR